MSSEEAMNCFLGVSAINEKKIQDLRHILMKILFIC